MLIFPKHIKGDTKMDKRIGAQYYTIRNFIKTIEDFDSSCKKIKDMGYKIVQISGTNLPAEPMKEILDKYELECVLTHRKFDDFKEDINEVINYNKILGSKICGLGMMPVMYYESKESVMQFIKEVKPICDAIKKEGMYFAYHNHAAEFMKRDGKLIFDYLVEETDPEIFNFTVDAYWCHVGGVDTVKVIEKLGKRAMVLHYKDYKVNEETKKTAEMAEIGNGNLDWDLITAVGEKVGSLYAVVEQDICPADPFDSLKISYDYLATKGFI